MGPINEPNRGSWRNGERGDTEDKLPGHKTPLWEEEIIPEGGWGWMIVVGSLLAHLIVGGIMRSGGLVFIKFEEKFNQSAADTAWAVSLNVTLRFLFGPLASVLCNRFNCRMVVIIGTLIATSGILVSGFAPNLWFTFFSNGFLSGLGQAFLYTSSVVIVGLYFHKRRSTAVGIANAGVGAGTFMFPPLLEYMFREYGFFGAFLILSALTFHGCVAGALYRPIEKHKKIVGTERIIHTYDEPNIDVKEQPYLSRTDLQNLSFLSLTYDINISGSFKHLDKNSNHDVRRTLLLKKKHLLEPDGRERAGSDVTNMRNMKNRNAENDLSNSTKSLSHDIKLPNIRNINDNKCIPAVKFPLLDSNESTVSGDTRQCDSDVKSTTSASGTHGKLFDITPLKDIRFTALCIGIGLLTLSFQASFVFLPSLVIEKGLTELQGTYLVSITGALETVGSVTTGFILDLECVRSHRMALYTAALFIMGVCTAVMPFLHYFIVYAIVCGIYGYLLGMCLAQKPTFVIEVIGIEYLVSAFGLLVWFQGIGTLIGPPLSGAIKDLSGRYQDGFFVGGAMLFAATAFQILERIMFFIRQRREKDID